MNLLLAFTAGIILGTLVNGRNDTFIDSLRKWLNATTKDNQAKRAQLEDNIEKNLPEFRQWMKQEAEKKRNLQRKLRFYFFLLIALFLLFQYIKTNAHPEKNKNTSPFIQTKK
ncbi:MAG: hypothetical protein D3920_11475 [Candidatus Electrothrix sp. AW2]|nr:hypothetical protein [Candidatus Electrothrix gigas]MCI5127870.1 hypothetical protein [Candidatus Electrothrix gigas]MCI5135667.1 hypothetical protein [Candidatus Electrothrix gigas]MCI5179126.1 hypothetical protein [Candidatus Electrothrix gigas]MCI5227473.1 hypothetical protein [Candidatus Electrothrix gigas]